MLYRQQLLETLELLAPLKLAGSWDNVGLLTDPHPTDPIIKSILLTIDLNEAVLNEAIAKSCQFIVSYHPILFRGTKNLLYKDSASRVIIRSLQHQITIYSPHTALDAAPQGVTDWLLGCVGKMHHVEAIETSLQAQSTAPTGMGRIGSLLRPTPLNEIIAKLKAELGLAYLRVATYKNQAPDVTTIHKVAVCPGAGGSIISQDVGQDLVVTGELSHHDILALQRRGINVILTEHTNCERGFLPHLQQRLKEHHAGLAIHISELDKDPLHIV